MKINVYNGGQTLTNRKAFTLIELLAVIVILAIIALIATPIVLNIINNTKVSANERSAENVLDAAKLYYSANLLDEKENLNGNIYDKVLTMLDGQNPDNGSIYVKENGEVALSLKYGEYCYTKEYSSSEIKVEKSDTCIAPIDYLMFNENVSSAEKTFLGGEIKRSEIETITMVDNIEKSNTSWDVSEKQNGSVMAWYKDEDNNGLYELYIGQEGGVKANPNSKYLFRYFSNVKSMDLTHMDTSNVTTMFGMFSDLPSLTTLDLSSFNTSKVTTMKGMFNNSSSLTSLDLSSFDTSNVTDMSYMFNGCKSLTGVYLSNFDTSKVTSMTYMFQYCENLATLNVSSFNTSEVTNMSYMFNRCGSLTNLDLSSFQTPKVTTMQAMFQLCGGLTNLNINNFNTSEVTDMSYMFSRCSSLTNLNTSSFKTLKLTNMSYMFYRCSGLTNLDLSSFETPKLTNMSAAFSEVHLNDLKLNKATFTSVTDFTDLFASSTITNIYTNKDSKSWIESRISESGLETTIYAE